MPRASAPRWALGGSQSSILSPQLCSVHPLSPTASATSCNLLKTPRFLSLAAPASIVPVPGGPLYLDGPEEPHSNMLKTKVSIFFPYPQSHFPFSVDDTTSTWSPKRETRAHFEDPSSACHQARSPVTFYSLHISASAALLHPHSAGSWQDPNWCPCCWPQFPLPLAQGSAVIFLWRATWWICLALWPQWSPLQPLSVKTAETIHRWVNSAVLQQNLVDKDRSGARFVP